MFKTQYHAKHMQLEQLLLFYCPKVLSAMCEVFFFLHVYYPCIPTWNFRARKIEKEMERERERRIMAPEMKVEERML